MTTKQLALCGMFAMLTFASMAQCDSELSAQTGTYSVSANPQKTDITTAPIALSECSQLEEIESKRENQHDVTVEIGNYIVLIYSRNRVANLNHTVE